MILHNTYLSDEELELLMEEAEADLVPAPPAVEEAVHLFLQNEERANQYQEAFPVKDMPDEPKQYVIHKKKKKSEYISYCLRISFAAAASIFMVFALSYMRDSGLDIENTKPKEEVLSKEMYLGMVQEQCLTEEVIREYQQMRECPSREEVLSETNFIYKIIEENTFQKTDEINQRKDNGGE